MVPFSTIQLALTILVLPLAAFAVMALAHRLLPRHGDWFATGTLGLALLAALVIFFRAIGSDSFLLADMSFNWLPMRAGENLMGGFMVDRLTAVMLIVVCLVSFLVHLFSSKYLAGDRRYGRYYCGLLLFSFSMLGLVLANNLLFLFIFWELVGLSSYLLIGHWYEKKSASNAAIKAFITTRVGDVGMFIGIMICYFKVGSLGYADIFAAVATGTLSGDLQTLAGLCIFLGAMGKSAQFPLHVWLPDAMEGPTPVSALIHAATMVAAGVYLVGRLLPLFDPQTLLFIAYIGGFTALFAATIAVVQDDIKKVLAYSTVSQLGYMTLALGVGGYVSGLFHLTTHAFFKAGLFLGSGAVIYAMHHEQSMKQYGGLAKKLPITATCYLLATLALVGFPGFSGFWSKDAILADALAFSLMHGHWFLPVAGFATVLLTAFYMFRQYFLTFTGKPRNQKAYDHAHEVPWQMFVPLIILGILAVTGGGFGGWFGEFNPKRDGLAQVQSFAKSGSDSVEVQRALQLEEAYALLKEKFHHESESAATAHGMQRHGEEATVGHSAGKAHGDSDYEHAMHIAHGLAMKLSTVLALLGIFLGWVMYYERKNGKALIDPKLFMERLKALHQLLWHKYFMDELYDNTVVKGTRIFGVISARFDRLVIDSVVNFVGYLCHVGGYLVELIDRVIVDWALVMGSARTTANWGRRLAALQVGTVRQYLFFTVIGLTCVSIFCIWIF